MIERSRRRLGTYGRVAVLPLLALAVAAPGCRDVTPVAHADARVQKADATAEAEREPECCIDEKAGAADGTATAARGTAKPAATDPAAVAAEETTPAQRYFTDVPLVDQHDRPRRLYSDLLRGKTVGSSRPSSVRAEGFARRCSRASPRSRNGSRTGLARTST